MGTYLNMRVRLYDLDYTLEIRDGNSDKSPLIGKFSEGHIPASIQSTRNHLWMK